ncbi:FtsW/RodA/SpoVE family cell cycle protein [Erysipelothrix urinaevulpis]|uniref:FtsW/RodA/SpoVE family cell cycle protein n=1 Tax=Erysipelothrix urinaevulpis TaxID=2683717 RepID=UPI00135C82ED|nr:FtsW/RodA/SpoVE family cell cycle protein [Erysipelothrix urinaevulpis]
MHKFINESKRHFSMDYTLLTIMLVLAITSVVSIYMAGPFLNAAEANKVVIRQIVWFGIGFTALFITLKLGIDRLFSLSYLAYWFLMACLVLLVIARYTGLNIPFITPIKGSYAWFQFPLFGSFQPSEFMKIVLVIIFADIIEKHNQEKVEMSFKSDLHLMWKMALYAVPALILNILQPDTGIPIIILVSLAIMFFLSGVRREWFIIIMSLALTLFFGIIYLYYYHQEFLNTLMGGGYRLDRFYGWLDFEEYSQTQGYQLFQSLLAVGTSGLTGHPYRTVVSLIPEAQTDFIFAVISQNFGFVGGTFVIITSFILDIKLILITLYSNLNKERYMMMGIVGMLMFQQFQNIGMILGLLPITGITLPFVSYGGSSLLSYMIPLAAAFFMSSETVNAHRH